MYVNEHREVRDVEGIRREVSYSSNRRYSYKNVVILDV